MNEAARQGTEQGQADQAWGEVFSARTRALQALAATVFNGSGCGNDS